MRTKIRTLDDLKNRKNQILEDEQDYIVNIQDAFLNIKNGLPLIGTDNSSSTSHTGIMSSLNLGGSSQKSNTLLAIIPFASLAMTNIAKYLPVKGKVKSLLKYLPLLLNFIIPFLRKK